MDLNSSQQTIDRTYVVLVSVWGAMIMSTALYGAVLFAQGMGGSISFEPFVANSGARIFGTFGIAFFVAAQTIPPWMERSPIGIGAAALECTRERQALNRHIVAKIVQFALIEGGALMGFAASMWTGVLGPFAAMAVIAAVSFAMARPTREALAMAARR